MYAVNLGLGAENPTGPTMAVVGRSMQLLAKETKDGLKRESGMKAAEKYLKKSLDMQNATSAKGEILYYLAEMAYDRGDKASYGEYLRQSRDSGFSPALKELKSYLDREKIHYSVKDISMPAGVKSIDHFNYSLRKNVGSALLSGTARTAARQGKKILRTSERILDAAIEKFLK
jgi:predicted metal-dependent hydrolase